jgi:hypothetical protein
MRGCRTNETAMSATATERQRRWRNRQARCQVVVPVVVSHEVIATLLDLRWLECPNSEDRARIGAAVSALLDEMATGNKP